MDWTKAKTILIIALIITDIFLIATYGGKHNTEESGNEEALAAVLKSSNIYVDAEKIPKKHRSKSEDESDKAYIEAAGDFISYLGMNSEYISDAQIVRKPADRENGGETVKVVFGCEVDKLKLDGSFMVCTFTGGEIVGFDSYWLEPGEFSAKKQETISAAAALISYMAEKEGTEEVRISDIELVYWVNSASYDSMEAVTDTALPTWRITFENGESVYIEAFGR